MLSKAESLESHELWRANWERLNVVLRGLVHEEVRKAGVQQERERESGAGRKPRVRHPQSLTEKAQKMGVTLIMRCGCRVSQAGELTITLDISQLPETSVRASVVEW